MLSFIYAECHLKALYTECHLKALYAECHYAECHSAEQSLKQILDQAENGYLTNTFA